MLSTQLLRIIASSLLALIICTLALALYGVLLRIIRGKEEPTQRYSERIQQLMKSLTSSSREVDAILSEIAKVASDRESSLKRLESELVLLEKKGKAVQAHIRVLEQVPVEVAEHFADLQKLSERRSARRDYFLFVSGVLVTTAFTIIIQLLFR